MENIKFDCRRLEKLMQLWRQPGDTVSPLFLALNIMDYAERLNRCGKKTPEADKIISREAGALAMARISFELLEANINQFMYDYQNGMVDEFIPDVASGIVDHYYSTELVLLTAERLGCTPDSRAAEIAAIRKLMKTAVDSSIELSDAVREYADSEPKGPELEPWKTLLKDAPDRLGDTVFFASYLDRR